MAHPDLAQEDVFGVWKRLAKHMKPSHLTLKRKNTSHRLNKFAPRALSWVRFSGRISH